MKRFLSLCALALTTGFSSQAQTPSSTTKIEWDDWGVPHITAKTESELFFAQGWAQMHNHANLILKLYGTSRGKAAAYWGERYANSDMLIHNLNFEQIASGYDRTQDPQIKNIFKAFTDGMNAYAKAHPEAIDKELQQVLPVGPHDVNMHSLFVFVTRFTGGGELDQIYNWKDMGSNAIAIGPKHSASGKAMLVQNPHLPWGGEFTWFESGLNLNGKLMYGAILVGMPGIAVGFNQNLGWTHTNNTLDNADSFEITLQDKGYLLDGKTAAFTVRPDTVWVKQADGKLSAKPFNAMETAFGTVFKVNGKKALAIKIAGMDRPNASLVWWRMANANNYEQFNAELKKQQIPFWNVIYADKAGNIFYMFNGLVPKRAYGSFSDWDKLIKTSSSKDIWKGYFSYDELPKLKNPKSGWLQNTNDPPWSVTIPRELDKDKYPAYIAPDVMSLRNQRTVRMLMGDKRLTFDDLLGYKLSTRVELADRVLDDLLAAIDANASPSLKECKALLSKWDRHADNDSKGMLLFFAWVSYFSGNGRFDYATPWDRNKPMETPKGIRDSKAALAALEKAANLVKTTFGDLATPWGDHVHVKRGNVDLPANGAPGDLVGIFRVSSFNRTGPKTAVVTSGDSYAGVVEFGDKVRAKVLTSYGNASQKTSPHNGDQLKLYSEKKMRDALFYPQDWAKHVKMTEVRSGNTFTSK